MPETRLIALGDIAVAEHRLRKLRENTANALTQSMSDQGQLQPIVVRPRKDGGHWLVAGLHRLAAARKLKWTEINCTIFDGMAADEAELAEIDENLIRAELSPAERAFHIKKRKELYENVHPETRKGGAPGRAGGGKKAKTAKLATFARDTATKTGVSRRSVERDATPDGDWPVAVGHISEQAGRPLKSFPSGDQTALDVRPGARARRLGSL